MTGDFEVLKYTQDKHPESHIHDFYEIFLSLSNDGHFFVGQRAYPLSLGTIFFLNPFEIHHCFCRGNKAYDRYVIHFTRERLQRLSTERSDLVHVFSNTSLVQQIPYEQLGRMLIRLSSFTKPLKDDFGADIERNISFDQFLLSIASSIKVNNETRIAEGEPRETRVNDILSYINKHYAENLTLDDLAARFFISKSRLSQIFKSTTGFSVGNYIIVYRIKRACELLRDGESVQKAGELVGFNNNTHFIRMFKQHIGCSPGRFSRNSQ